MNRKWVFSFFVFIFTTAAVAAVPFKNPIVDDRIEFISCGSTKGLVELAEGSYGSMLCWGSLKEDKQRIIYVYLAEGTYDLIYFEQTDRNQTFAVGEQGGGIIDEQLKLTELDSDLSSASHAHVSTLKFHTEWDYSEGGTTLTGRLPGMKEKMFFVVFGLDSIDDELSEI